MMKIRFLITATILAAVFTGCQKQYEPVPLGEQLERVLRGECHHREDPGDELVRHLIMEQVVPSGIICRRALSQVGTC